MCEDGQTFLNSGNVPKLFANHHKKTEEEEYHKIL